MWCGSDVRIQVFSASCNRSGHWVLVNFAHQWIREYYNSRLASVVHRLVQEEPGKGRQPSFTMQQLSAWCQGCVFYLYIYGRMHPTAIASGCMRMRMCVYVYVHVCVRACVNLLVCMHMRSMCMSVCVCVYLCHVTVDLTLCYICGTLDSSIYQWYSLWKFASRIRVIKYSITAEVRAEFEVAGPRIQVTCLTRVLLAAVDYIEACK